MFKVLILGSTGFIGRVVCEQFSNNSGTTLLKHSRKQRPLYISDDYLSDDFIRILSSIDYIINCTGVGLSKLHKSEHNANTLIVEKIVEAINISENKNLKLIHISSLKANNTSRFKDIYADDKYGAEQVIKNSLIYNRSIILRIPAIFGKGDKNIEPITLLSRLSLLPIIKNHTLPKIHFCDVSSLACIIHELVVSNNCPFPSTIYVVSTNMFDWNDLASSINKIKNKNSPSISIGVLYMFWNLLKLANYLSRSRAFFPDERLDDLFFRSWSIDDKKSIFYTNDKLDVTLKKALI